MFCGMTDANKTEQDASGGGGEQESTVPSKKATKVTKEGVMLGQERSSPSLAIRLPPTKRATKGPNTNQLQFLRFSAMKTVMRHPASLHFKNPVDPSKVPTYYNFIEEPMDLGTIRDRLINRYYQSSDECFQDFQQLFCNCYVYNEPDTPIVKQARELEMTLLRTITDMPENEEVIPEGHKVVIRKSNSQEIRVEDEDNQSSSQTISPSSSRKSLRLTKAPARIKTMTGVVGGGKGKKILFSSDDSLSGTETEEAESCSGIEDEEEKYLKKREENRDKRMALLQQQMANIGKQMELLGDEKKDDAMYMKRKKRLSKKYSKKNSTRFGKNKAKVLPKARKIQAPKSSNGTLRSATSVAKKRAKATSSSESSNSDNELGEGDSSITSIKVIQSASAAKKLKTDERNAPVSPPTSNNQSPSVAVVTRTKATSSSESSNSDDDPGEGDSSMRITSKKVIQSASAPAEKLKTDEKKSSPSPPSNNQSSVVATTSIRTIGSSIDRRDKCRHMTEIELIHLLEMINQLEAEDNEEVMQSISNDYEDAWVEDEEGGEPTLDLKALPAKEQWTLLATVEEKLKKQMKVTAVAVAPKQSTVEPARPALSSSPPTLSRPPLESPPSIPSTSPPRTPTSPPPRTSPPPPTSSPPPLNENGHNDDDDDHDRLTICSSPDQTDFDIY